MYKYVKILLINLFAMILKT